MPEPNVIGKLVDGDIAAVAELLVSLFGWKIALNQLPHRLNGVGNRLHSTCQPISYLQRANVTPKQLEFHCFKTSWKGRWHLNLGYYRYLFYIIIAILVYQFQKWIPHCNRQSYDKIMTRPRTTIKKCQDLRGAKAHTISLWSFQVLEFSVEIFK